MEKRIRDNTEEKKRKKGRKKLKAIISSSGRFHAFRLAEQLKKANALDCLYSQEWLRKSDMLSKEDVKGKPFLKALKLLELVCLFMPMLRSFLDKVLVYKAKSHDRFVASELKKRAKKNNKANVFIGWLGDCLESLKQAKKSNMLTIVECGSTHPRFHRDIVAEEYLRAAKLLEQELKKENAKKQAEKAKSKKQSFASVQTLINLAKSIKKKKEKQHMLRALKELDAADYIAIPSSFVKKTFIKNKIAEKKLIVVPYGADLKLFKKQEKKDKVFRVIWCGTLTIRKGIHYLLKAFSELDLPKAELWLIGSVEPDIVAFIELYKKRCKNSKIMVLGPKKQSELAYYYSQGSVFVHASVQEGMSMVLLEALACGLPVICTENTGGQDIIEDNKDGFVIKIRDTKAIKDKLLLLYKNKKLLKNISNAAIKNAKKFTWHNYGKRIIREYKKRI